MYISLLRNIFIYKSKKNIWDHTKIPNFAFPEKEVTKALDYSLVSTNQKLIDAIQNYDFFKTFQTKVEPKILYIVKAKW